MFSPGDIISYRDMCNRERASLQHGMNYHLQGSANVVLMSRRPDAPYSDRIEEDGRVLIYEGHDAPRKAGGPDPKTLDQPMYISPGVLSRNGRFYEAAKRAERGELPEIVRVYEKIRTGIWAFNGVFRLTASWILPSESRNVFKFRLELIGGEPHSEVPVSQADIPHERLIPSSVKLEVWKRDGGKCVQCGNVDNLHFDHILPFSKGGTSIMASNIQLLCARHNLQKRDKIE